VDLLISQLDMGCSKAKNGQKRDFLTKINGKVDPEVTQNDLTMCIMTHKHFATRFVNVSNVFTSYIQVETF
jgi:hypothetical protein